MSSHNTPTLTPAGDSLGTATPIGGSDIRNSYLLELGNFNDFYSFIASSDGELTASLTSISTESELSADLDLIVYEEFEFADPVAWPKTRGRFDEEVTFEATQGTEYFIWVEHYAGGASNYSLITSFTESGDSSSPDHDPDTPTEPPVDDGDPYPDIDAGDSFAEATTLGANATREEWAWIENDAEDYFRVTAPGDGDLTVSLSGLSDDLDLRIYDADRNELDRSTSDGSSDETVTASVESGGPYFVRVDAFYSPSESAYTLTTEFEAAEDDTPTDPEPDIDLDANTWVFPDFQVDVSGARDTGQSSSGEYIALGSNSITFANGVVATVSNFKISPDGSEVFNFAHDSDANDIVTEVVWENEKYPVVLASWGADFEAKEIDSFSPKGPSFRVDRDYLTELFFGDAPGELLPPDPLPEQGSLTVSDGAEERSFTTGFLQINGLSDEQPYYEYLRTFVNVDSATISPLAGEGELKISAGSVYDSELYVGRRDLRISYKDLAVTTDEGSEFTFDTAEKTFSLDFAHRNYFPIEIPTLQASSGNLGTLDGKSIDRIEFERDDIFFVMDGGSERLDYDAFTDLVDTVSSDAPPSEGDLQDVPGRLGFEIEVDMLGNELTIPVFSLGDGFQSREEQLAYFDEHFYVKKDGEEVRLNDETFSFLVGASRTAENLVRSSFESDLFYVSDIGKQSETDIANALQSWRTIGDEFEAAASEATTSEQELAVGKVSYSLTLEPMIIKGGAILIGATVGGIVGATGFVAGPAGVVSTAAGAAKGAALGKTVGVALSAGKTARDFYAVDRDFEEFEQARDPYVALAQETLANSVFFIDGAANSIQAIGEIIEPYGTDIDAAVSEWSENPVAIGDLLDINTHMMSLKAGQITSEFNFALLQEALSDADLEFLREVIPEEAAQDLASRGWFVDPERYDIASVATDVVNAYTADEENGDDALTNAKGTALEHLDTTGPVAYELNHFSEENLDAYANSVDQGEDLPLLTIEIPDEPAPVSIRSNPEAEVKLLGLNPTEIRGGPADLHNDQFVNFQPQHQVVLEGTVVPEEQIRFELGSVIVHMDTNGNGSEDTTLKFNDLNAPDQLSIQNTNGDTIISRADPTITSDYAIIMERVPIDEDYEQIIDDRFGDEATLADWNVLSTRYAEEGGDFLRDAGLVQRDEEGVSGGAITRDGDRFWSGDRHYSFTWGDVPATYLSHDSVTYNGVPLHLGSWYTDKQIFADISGLDTPPSGDPVITGGADDDTLEGTVGNDTINGGAGFDTALYSGDQSSYTLTLSPTSTTVTDRRTDGNGTDTLIDMELLDFDSGDVDLNQFGGTTGLSERNFESFIEIYIAYFNRAPDAIGLNFWGTAFANGTSLEEMAALFAPQDETLETYPPGTSNEDFATSVYNNVLGRDPDLDGFNFWVGQLDAGNFSRDQFILEVLQGVQNGSPDRDYLDNKVDIGAYFAVHKGMSDVDNAEDAMAVFGDQDTSDIDGAVDAIDNFHTDALDPNGGEFLMPLVGVLDDPFAMA